MPHIVIRMGSVLPQYIISSAVQLPHPPVHAETLDHEQQVAALLEGPLTDQVLGRDEQLIESPQPVRVCLFASPTEAEVPVTLSLRSDIVKDLLEDGQ